MIPIPCQRGARIGLAVFVVLWALLGAIEWCRAEVPPTIEPRVKPPRARLHKAPRAPAHVELVCEGGPLLEAEDDIQERLEVERHLASCSRASGRSDPWMVLSLVRLERELGAPVGLLSAVACWETGYTHGARGDWRDGRARAHGVLQLHGWWRAWCGWKPGARDNVEAAARCYWARVEHYLEQPRVAGCNRPVVVAEAMAANGVKYGPWGCAARSRHVEEWEGWR